MAMERGEEEEEEENGWAFVFDSVILSGSGVRGWGGVLLWMLYNTIEYILPCSVYCHTHIYAFSSELKNLTGTEIVL